MTSAGPEVLVLSGALRADSWNRKLARLLARRLQDAGATVSLLDPRDYPAPPYDGDLEARDGLPTPVRDLQHRFSAAQGFVLCTPEYNGSLPGTFKNLLDWLSRPSPDIAFSNKIAALTSASPGALGGLRALSHARDILQSLGVLTLSVQVAVPRAHEAFGDDGELRDARLAQALTHLAASLVITTRALAGSGGGAATG